jgi:Mlc titration factor MtfA (ptsG expression regulator)
LQLNEPMRLFVAAQACVLILELGLDYYRGWSEIVVYPAQFVPRHLHVDEFGVVHQGDQPYAGEAWLRGPVVLSWEDVAGSHWPDGANVVIHEFAHQLDQEKGFANGAPLLPARRRYESWSTVLLEEFQRLQAASGWRRGHAYRPTLPRIRANSSPC